MASASVLSIRIASLRGYVLIVLLLIGLSNSANADDDDAPSADKSGYTLFNPVPADELRDFSPDRPTKAANPTTVDAGHFQYEADIANWTYDRYNSTHVTASDLIVASPTLKAGLTTNTDLELAFAPFNFLWSNDRSSGNATAINGVGDIYARLKYNLLGNDGGPIALAVTPYVKAPTASSGVGNNHWEGGAYAPLSINLPLDWQMTFQTEVDLLERADLTGTFANYQNLINFSHLIADKVTGYAEIWSDVSTDRNASTQYTGDLSLGWMVENNMQLDAGVNIGLNKAAPDLQAYAGISQRF